ncbi:MAG: redoxin domain-containing protein, partial [Bacteroidales bacterium]|nr:redoxin domain-containing protein [Bacteroidales bacterium]
YPGFWWDKIYPLEWVPKMIERIQNNKIGSVANDMVLLNRKGRPVKLSSFNSKYTVLYFLDPDCSICKPFSMELKKIYNSLKKRGVTVISINSGGNSNEFFEYNRKNKHPWPGLSPKDENYYELFDKFETEQVPMIYLLDNNRRIMAKKINTITLDKLVK